MRPNRLKAKLRDARVGGGVSIMIPSPQVVEMVGRLGFDWVLLDCEHGTISIESLELMTIAAEAAGITAVARPRTSAPDQILEVLERGVGGVQAPHVDTPSEARAVVDAALYHPLGRRSLAARTRPAGYGLDRSLADYAEGANAEILVCIQVESGGGLDHLDEILEVDGIDVVFLGPSDLSQSLGHPGRADHPDVQRALDDGFAAIVRSDRAAGTAGDAGSWRRWQDRGVTYLYTHLPALLDAGSRPYLESTASRNHPEPNHPRERTP